MMNKFSFILFVLLLAGTVFAVQVESKIVDFNVEDKSVIINDLDVKEFDQVQWRNDVVYIENPTLVQGESLFLNGYDYVNYYSKKGNINIQSFPIVKDGPALAYNVIYWLIPEEYSIDDIQVNVEYNYTNYNEIDYRVGPGLNKVKELDDITKVQDNLPEGQEIGPMMEQVMEPNENLYETNNVYEGEIKLDEINMGNGLKQVKIFVPIMKYKISKGKNYMAELNSAEIEIVSPYKNIDRHYYRYENLLSNSNNYELYKPSSYYKPVKDSTKSGMESYDFSVSSPQLLSASDIVNPDKSFDYIIITADEFYPDSASSSYPLYEFAMHKKDYNDFDVAIVNFDDIVSQYTDGGFTYFEEGWIGSEYIGASTNSKKIRHFLSFAWDNWNATHSLDGKPLYVLLVGDADFDSSSANWFLPTPIIFNKYCEDYETCPTYGDARAAIPDDNCYADFDSDCWGSTPVMSVGRFSVQSTAELDSMVDKSIHFESDPTSGGTEIDWLSRYTTKDDHSWRQTHSYQNQMFFTKTVPAIMDKHWDVEYFRPQQLGSPFRAELEDRLEDGTVVFAHNSHGSITSGGGNGLYNFPSDGLIDNSYKNMIFLSDTCSAGGFHDGDYKSWVEKVVSDTTYPTRGAVASMGNGIIATWGRAYAGHLPAEILMKDRIQLVYDSDGNIVTTSTLGHTKTTFYNEMFLGFDRTSDSSTVTDEFSNAMSINLMGDPSLDLNIFTEDYTINDTAHADEVIVQLIQFPDPHLIAGRTVQAQTFVTNVGSTTLTNLDFSIKHYSLGGTELPLYGFEGIVYSLLDTSTLSSIAPNETKLVTFDFTMPSETTFIYFKVELEEDLDEYEKNNAFVLLVNNNDPTLGEPEIGRIWMDSSELTCSGNPPLNSNQYGSCEGSKQVCLTPSACTGTATETSNCRGIADAECSDYYEILDFYGEDYKVQCMLGSGGYNCYANDRVEYICTTDTPVSFWIDSYKFISGNKWRGSWDSQLLTYANRFYPSWVNKDCNARTESSDPFHETEEGYELNEMDTYWSVGRWDLNDYDDMEEKPQYITDSYNCGKPGNVCKENELCLGVNCGNFTIGSTDLYEAQGYMCESAECVVVDSDQDGYADYIPGIHAERFNYDLYDDPFGHFGSWDDVNYYYTSTFFFRGSAGSTDQYRLTPPYHDWILPYDEKGYDCNEGDISINPSAEEVCDGIDNNCAGVCVGGTRTGEPCSWGEEYAYELWCPGSSCYMKISYTTLGQCNYGGGTCHYVDEGLPVVATYYEDADGDGYGNPLVVLESCMEGSVPDGMSADNTDCDDTNEFVNPGATEVCDNIDNDCNTVIDGITDSCGTGDCAGDKTCTSGSWSDCSTYGYDAGVCAYCGPDGEDVYDESQDDDCDNFLYCDGVEECAGIGTCTTPSAIDCSGSNLASIETCFNSPDSIDFTLDYFAGFTSTCNEATDSCNTGSVDLTHTCDVTECGAECDAGTTCDDNSCDETYYDYCNVNRLVEYNSNYVLDSVNILDSCSNDCESDCGCTDCVTDCSAPVTSEYCVEGVCGAECAEASDCEAYCSANIYMNTGTCDAGCGCNYVSEDCDAYDAWEVTGTDRWIDETECTERQEIEEEYKDYSCGVGGCDYSVTTTRWVATSNLRNKDEGSECDDGAFCTERDVCTSGVCGGNARDCSGSDLASISTCFNSPDSIDFTFDYFVGFTSTCNEETDSCNTGSVDLTHTCDVTECGADCAETSDCEAYCSANIYMDSGTCDSECGCNYVSEDCDTYDAWEVTGTDRWIDETECTERQEIEEEYKDYSCGVGGCDYSVTTTRWVATSNLRNKDEGSECDDGAFCTERDVCTSGVCGGNARDCSGSDLASISTCFNSPDSIDFTFDYFVGFTSTCNEETDSCNTGSVDLTHTCDVTECGAECDAETTCDDTDCSSLNECVGNDYYEYDNVSNDCLSACECDSNDCSGTGYTISYDDVRCLGEEYVITSCQKITEAGTYYLTDDLVVDYTSGSILTIDSGVVTSTTPNMFDSNKYYPSKLLCCLQIESDDVTINLMGNNLKTNDLGMSQDNAEFAGICSFGQDNININNGQLEKWDRGVVITNADTINLENVYVLGEGSESSIDTLAYGAGDGKSSGVSICNSNNINYDNMTTELYYSGFQVMASNDITISNSGFGSNSRGIQTMNWPYCASIPYTEDEINHNLTVENNLFADCNVGLMLAHTNTANVHNNNFTVNRDMAIDIYDRMVNTNISYNQFTDTGYDPIGETLGAVVFRYVNDIRYNNYVSNNNFNNNTIGIYFKKAGDYSDDAGGITISNNIIDQSRDYGVYKSPEFMNADYINFNDNQIINNNVGVKLEHECTTDANVEWMTLDLTGWTGDYATLTISDDTGTIGSNTIVLPLNEYDSSNAYFDVSTILGCYETSASQTFNIQTKCNAMRGSSGYEFATQADITLQIYDVSESLVNEYSETFTAESPTNFGNRNYREMTIDLPINGEYTINGTVECEYASEIISHDIDYQLLNVESGCPTDYINIINHPQADEIIVRGSVPSLIAGVMNDLFVQAIQNSDNCISPTLTIESGTDSYTTSIAGTTYHNDITFDNDYICGNTNDVEDTVTYSDSYGSDYSNVTCDSGSSLSYGFPCTTSCTEPLMRELECSENKHCDELEYCDDGYCELVECECGNINNHVCYNYQCCDDLDCKTNYECVSHQCLYLKQWIELECVNDNDCRNYEECDYNKCVNVSCVDCGYIKDHECYSYQCCNDNDCPKGYNCNSHYCREDKDDEDDVRIMIHNPIEYECQSSSDCDDSICTIYSGCIGEIWYEYSDVQNTCNQDHSCTMNVCSDYDLSWNDPRCVMDYEGYN